MIKIAIVDDHLIFLDSLEKFLNKVSEFKVVFKSSSAEKLLSKLNRNELESIDIILLDIKMKGLSGLECLKVLKENYPQIKVIIVSMFNEYSFVKKALDLGALSFIPKDIDSRLLIKAIYSVSRNGFYVCESLSNYLVDNLDNTYFNEDNKQSFEKITKSELHVLLHLCQGMTASEIGEKIFKSTRTIEGYKQRLMDKTRSKNTASLVAWAFRNGIIS